MASILRTIEQLEESVAAAYTLAAIATERRLPMKNVTEAGQIETVDVSDPLAAIKAYADRLAAASHRYQGHAFVAFLRKLTRDPDWEAKARTYKTLFEREVTAPASTGIYRIRSNFAVIWAGGALAIDYGVLPWKKSRLRKAVEKCFRRAVAALQSPEAVNVAQADQHGIPDDPVEALKEKLDQCKLCKVTPRKKVSKEEVEQRQNADGFIIDGVIYAKQGRLKAWFPEKSARKALRQKGVFRTTRADTPTVIKKVAGIKGRPRYYAINANTPKLSKK